MSYKRKRKVLELLMLFKNLLAFDEYRRERNKIWVDKSSEFCNRSIRSWLQDNDIEVYSTHNKRKSVPAERFIRNLKTKIWKHDLNIKKCAYWK